MPGRVKTRETKTGEIIAYSETAIRNNISAVEYCRTSMAAISGCAAGEPLVKPRVTHLFLMNFFF